MSHSSKNIGKQQTRRSMSSASQPSDPRNIVNSSLLLGSENDSRPGSPDRYHGSWLLSEDRRSANSSSLSQKEPTRSFVTSSYRGSLAPVDNAQHARSVREDTAELASYILSDKASSTRSSSPHPRRSSESQTWIESYFSDPNNDSDLNASRTSNERPDAIEEVSEPQTPEERAEGSGSLGTSVIASMLRNSPPRATSSNEGLEALVTVGAPPSSARGSPDPDQLRLVMDSKGLRAEPSERSPLLGKGDSERQRPDWIRGDQDLERQGDNCKGSWPNIRGMTAIGLKYARAAVSPKGWDRRAIIKHAVVAPAGYLPSVVLGCLLNVLDALSYGMILFPLGQPIFAKLGPAGISMFYISCIISQLVYSCGGSMFKGGIGSEMIEVVPFFHKMAFTIMARVGENNPEAVIATTITAYALSSILTGLVFFLMGVCKFGYIVGFIPRHILIGCIGGVGWFLVATGFEVTARLEGNLNYSFATLKQMFRLDTLPLWLIPFCLAIFLSWSDKKIANKYYIPGFILAIPAVFYFFVFSLDELNPPDLRKSGWIFIGPDAGEPWWHFYTLYKFELVNWRAIAETIPAMFALTFFGVLHVPINVPALAFNLGEDHLNLDKELIAHGLSNALSGFAGSIQNYLVYTNSVLFIRSGGTGRLAGIMLAIATTGIMMIGPVIIGYIPVMMVGVLIFVLGFELFLEAVWGPRKKLGHLEYLTVLAIVLVMGIYDFVIGIFVGIGLAFVSQVVQTSRIPAVRASYSGEIAGSTVRRNPVQYKYLREVGRQIHVTKLAGYLFFGTIVSVEERIRSLIDDEAFNQRPIRYLIFDIWHVTGIDYSAAEAFSRINRIFSAKGVTMVVSGVNPGGPLGLSLRAVGLGLESTDSQVRLFDDLNSALESCENELLKAFYASKEARAIRNAPSPSYLDVPGRNIDPHTTYTMDAHSTSPRRRHLQQAAATTLNDNEFPVSAKWHNFKQPLPLILQTFQGLSAQTEDFWFPVLPFFQRRAFAAGATLYERGEPAQGFYLLEQGMLRADYDLPQGRYFESIVAGTTCGELPFFSETDRTATVQAERDCVTWLMDCGDWERLQRERQDVAQELLRISLKLTSERMSAITSYVLTTAG